MHGLTIKKSDRGVRLLLDDFELDGVQEYKIESSADGPTELSIKIMVSIAEIGGNGATDNRCSDLSKDA